MVDRENVIAALQSHIVALEADEESPYSGVSYDGFMEALEVVDPKFSEVDSMVSGTSLEDVLEDSLRERPEALEYMLSLADSPEKMSNFIDLLKFEPHSVPEGMNTVIHIFSGLNRDGAPMHLVNGEWKTAEVKALEPTLELVEQSGLADLADKANVGLVDISLTSEDLVNLALTATAVTPIGGARLAAGAVLTAKTAPTLAARAAPAFAAGVRESLVRSPSWFKHYMTGPINRLQLMGGAALVGGTVYGFSQLEEQTGGAISEAIIRGAASSVVEGYNALSETLSDEEKRAQFAEMIHDVEDFSKIVLVDPATQATLNMTIIGAQEAMPDDPDAGQNAAVAFQFRNPALLSAKLAVRALAYNEIYPDLSQDQRDRLLAQGLIEDVIRGSHSSALDGRPVTAEHIEVLLKENPSILENIQPVNLRNGLQQVFPSLVPEDAIVVAEQQQIPDGSQPQVSVPPSGSNIPSFRNAAAGLGIAALLKDIGDAFKAIKNFVESFSFENMFDRVIDFITGAKEGSLEAQGNLGLVPIPVERRAEFDPHHVVGPADPRPGYDLS